MINRTVELFKDYCLKHSFRITTPRLSVYKIVLEANKPVTAYDVLDILGKEIKNPKPPTAYRALDFLTQHGFVHRIESLNAYVSCNVNHKHTGSQFMICDHCGQVEEIHLCTFPDSLEERISSKNFNLYYWNIEVHGCCCECACDNDILK
ncbi:MAG: transcriptional repressor [Alphaproteobacteria bacterium]|nr:transcriptional repressor [Alphaproteobacteria bacterium]